MSFLLSGHIVVAQDAATAGQRALEKQRLPWLDAQTDEIKTSVELPTREAARSLDHTTIAVRKTPVKRDWGWNWDLSWLGDLSWLFWIGLVAIFLVLMVWVVRNVDTRPSLTTDAPEPRRTRAQSVAQLPFAVDSGSHDFRVLAAEAYRQGNFRQAIVWLFSHVLVALDQQHLIRLKKGKTNRQYLNELRSRRPLSDYYTNVMLPFEATFFGDRDLTGAQFEQCWNELESFEQQLAAAKAEQL